MPDSYVIGREHPVLITGSNGFIGARVVAELLDRGYSNLRCLVRPSGNLDRLEDVLSRHAEAHVEVLKGNLLSREDCERAVKGVRLIYHLAAGIDKSFAAAFMNSVVTTRNLLDAGLHEGALKRFVNVSSFAVYSNRQLKRGALLDESCAIENPPYARSDAYAYAKIKQDELVLDYARNKGLGCVIVRPGAVYGPGKRAVTGRVGIDTFGVYLHLGGAQSVAVVVCGQLRRSDRLGWSDARTSTGKSSTSSTTTCRPAARSFDSIRRRSASSSPCLFRFH